MATLPSKAFRSKAFRSKAFPLRKRRQAVASRTHSIRCAILDTEFYGHAVVAKRGLRPSRRHRCFLPLPARDERGEGWGEGPLYGSASYGLNNILASVERQIVERGAGMRGKPALRSDAARSTPA